MGSTHGLKAGCETASMQGLIFSWARTLLKIVSKLQNIVELAKCFNDTEWASLATYSLPRGKEGWSLFATMMLFFLK